MDREAIPLMELGMQLHLAILSLLDIVSIFDVFGVNRERPPYIPGITRQVYSPKIDEARITSLSMRL